MGKREFAVHVEGGLATVMMNWPERVNALGVDFSEDLERVLDGLAANAAVRAVILTGAGKVFCGGGDLNEIMSPEPTDMEREFALIRGYNRIARRLHYFDVPVIAAVNGPAAGGGAGLALACDFAIAAETARYDFYFHRVGLSAADVGVPWFLNRAIGPVLTAYYLLTGGSIDARTGLRLGLFAQIVSGKDLLSTARAAAAKILEAPEPAVRISKLSLRRTFSMDLDTTLEVEAYLQSYAFRTPGHKKRLAQMRERLAKKGG